MEVTTVSPSPASPTEGDDLCVIDVTNMATHSVTLLICLCGLAGNWAVLRLLSWKSEDNFVVHAVALIDFLFLLLTAPSALLFLVEDVSCSPIMPLLYLSLLFRLAVFSCYSVPFFLISFSILEFIDKLWNLCCRRKPPDNLDFVVIVVLFWAFSALFSEIPTVTLLCPSHEQEHCRAALITMWAIMLLLFFAPMTVKVISTTINLIKAKWGSQHHQPDRFDIVICITGLLNLLFIIWNFLQQLGSIAVPSHFHFLIICTYSSIKPFIYFLMGRCWSHCSVESLRLSLHRVFEEPEENTAHSNDPAMDTRV